MVAFPASANESAVLTDAEEGPAVEVAAATERHEGAPVAAAVAPVIQHRDDKTGRMAPGKDSVVLTLSVAEPKGADKTGLDLPSVEAITIQAESAIVKKIAAGLKSCGKETSDRSSEIGSLSSGSSIVTICSVTSSEPKPDDSVTSCGSGDGVGGVGGGDDPEAPPTKQKKKRRSRLITEETWYHTGLQISVPFFIAGIGTIGAGLVLARVKDWEVFVKVSQIFILVPALLGLKGNLDMCLASRLSTQSNLGNMKGYREVIKMIIGNIALVQIQAIVAAVLVALFATAVGAAMDGKYSWEHTLLLVASSVSTATSSCFILDFAMVAVIMGSQWLRMNPDNLATPLAASIGDVVSISVLSAIASALFNRLEHEIWVLYAIVAAFLVMLPIWIVIVLKNKYTRNVLTSGWIPVITALFISGLGGLILDKALGSLKGFEIFQPIVNGIGGNLVSVQASRISTMLHQSTIVGILPPWTKTWVSPWTALFHGEPSAKTARLLIAMSIPGHVAFSFAADYMQWSRSTIHVYFMLAYLTVTVLQVILLLYVAHIMIHVMWKYKIDPDNSAIPYLTALGDLSGSLLLAGAFLFLQQINHPYKE